MSRIEIYPISYYKGHVEDNEKLKGMVMPLVEKTKDECEDPEGWLTTNITTSFANAKVSDELAGNYELKRQYFNVIKRFFDDKFTVEIDEIWYNSYSNGEYQESHNHVGDPINPTHFACVHFLSFDPEIHSPLTFSDPLSLTRYHSIDMKSANYSEKYNPPVVEGDLLMFPSYLEHEVKSYPPTPDKPRVTISFNLTVTSYGSDDDDA